MTNDTKAGQCACTGHWHDYNEQICGRLCPICKTIRCTSHQAFIDGEIIELAHAHKRITELEMENSNQRNVINDQAGTLNLYSASIAELEEWERNFDGVKANWESAERKVDDLKKRNLELERKLSDYEGMDEAFKTQQKRNRSLEEGFGDLQMNISDLEKRNKAIDQSNLKPCNHGSLVVGCRRCLEFIVNESAWGYKRLAELDTISNQLEQKLKTAAEALAAIHAEASDREDTTLKAILDRIKRVATEAIGRLKDQP